MDIKKIFQYCLLFSLIILSYLFYYKYFSENGQRIENEKTENIFKNEKPITNQQNTNNNIIENLKYTSEDLLGNTYTVTAKSATLKEDELNEIQLFEVNAEIARENQEVIYIFSKTANYNKLNNNTIFKKKVNVKYGDQTIDSEILNLNFNDNLIKILEDVYYVNKDTKIYADKVEIDLLYKKLKISMINKLDKVNITSKY